MAESRDLTNLVYEISRQDKFSRDFGLRDQIRRAAGSTMHNIAEGFDAGSDPEFARFLKYARRSASEVQSQLYTALDQHYISQSNFHNCYDQATQLKKLINGLISYLKK